MSQRWLSRQNNVGPTLLENNVGLQCIEVHCIVPTYRANVVQSLVRHMLGVCMDAMMTCVRVVYRIVPNKRPVPIKRPPHKKIQDLNVF